MKKTQLRGITDRKRMAAPKIRKTVLGPARKRITIAITQPKKTVL
jgi:hypothetical protein